MVKRIVVGAHYGLRSFLVQRVSAVAMALYALLFVALLIFAPPRGYEAWKALFANQAMKLATFVFLASLFLHAWVGMRDIFMDYVHHTGARLALQVTVILLLVAYAGWALQILWEL
jgi:succinate dehydrogenase / fumarate reductase membrane anchor subunit